MAYEKTKRTRPNMHQELIEDEGLRWWRIDQVDKTQSFDKDTNGLSVREDQGTSLHTHCHNPKISWGRFWWQHLAPFGDGMPRLGC